MNSLYQDRNIAADRNARTDAGKCGHRERQPVPLVCKSCVYWRRWKVRASRAAASAVERQPVPKGVARQLSSSQSLLLANVRLLNGHNPTLTAPSSRVSSSQRSHSNTDRTIIAGALRLRFAANIHTGCLSCPPPIPYSRIHR